MRQLYTVPNKPATADLSSLIKIMYDQQARISISGSYLGECLYEPDSLATLIVRGTIKISVEKVYQLFNVTSRKMFVEENKVIIINNSCHLHVELIWDGAFPVVDEERTYKIKCLLNCSNYSPDPSISMSPRAALDVLKDDLENYIDHLNEVYEFHGKTYSTHTLKNFNYDMRFGLNLFTIQKGSRVTYLEHGKLKTATVVNFNPVNFALIKQEGVPTRDLHLINIEFKEGGYMSYKSLFLNQIVAIGGNNE